jgi:glucose/arabinose dehydrogenase
VELVPVASGFSSPLDIQQAGDGSGRLFVVEQGGKIKIIQNGSVSITPYLDVSGLISTGSEEGLLGLAFHPSFSTNGCFYVNYTSTRNGTPQTFISEFHATPPSANMVNVTSEQNLFTVNQPEANHNGGGLAFGNDGFLYIALGDGGGGGDQHGTIGNGQDLTTRLGKMLRISVTCNGTFTVPSDNPFFTSPPNAAKEIWLYGLRNPFRFSVDRATGNLWIGDVGQDSFEEVDRVMPAQGGSNMGWRCKEGTHNFNFSVNCQGLTLRDPIFDYDHSQNDETVIGGYVYHGTNIAALAGNYVFGDFISGRIWSLAQNGQGQWVRTFLVNAGGGDLAGFGQDAAGELYVARYSSGAVARLHQVGTP